MWFFICFCWINRVSESESGSANRPVGHYKIIGDHDERYGHWRTKHNLSSVQIHLLTALLPWQSWRETNTSATLGPWLRQWVPLACWVEPSCFLGSQHRRPRWRSSWVGPWTSTWRLVSSRREMPLGPGGHRCGGVGADCRDYRCLHNGLYCFSGESPWPTTNQAGSCPSSGLDAEPFPWPRTGGDRGSDSCGPALGTCNILPKYRSWPLPEDGSSSSRNCWGRCISHLRQSPPPPLLTWRSFRSHGDSSFIPSSVWPASRGHSVCPGTWWRGPVGA